MTVETLLYPNNASTHVSKVISNIGIGTCNVTHLMYTDSCVRVCVCVCL